MNSVFKKGIGKWMYTFKSVANMRNKHKEGKGLSMNANFCYSVKFLKQGPSFSIFFTIL